MASGVGAGDAMYVDALQDGEGQGHKWKEMICHHCGKQGHKLQECWYRKGGVLKGQPQQQKGYAPIGGGNGKSKRGRRPRKRHRRWIPKYMFEVWRKRTLGKRLPLATERKKRKRN